MNYWVYRLENEQEVLIAQTALLGDAQTILARLTDGFILFKGVPLFTKTNGVQTRS